jgi:hypothetical protein
MDITCFKRVYRKLLFKKKSHFLMNRVTLRVDDPILSEKILLHRNFQFNRLFLGITIAFAIQLFVLVILYFSSSGYLPLIRVVSACLDLSFCIIWFILRICRLKKGLTLLTPLYLITQCIIANLSLRKLLPEMLTEFEAEVDERKILITWLLCHCTDYNSITVR